MTYTYKKGYREGVVFAFVDNKMRSLVEYRPVNEETQVFFPSGSIEAKDKIGDKCYKQTALFREIHEEFNSSIQVNTFDYLDEVYVDQVNLVFYVYVITKWQGNFPEYIIEEDEQPSKLEWISLEDYDTLFDFDSAKEISKIIIQHLDNKRLNK